MYFKGGVGLSKKQRIIEIDAVRGFAVVLMMLFHMIFDLVHYFDYGISYTQGFWKYAGMTAAILFMIVSGISGQISRSNIKRGLKVLACAMIITIASIPIMGEYYISFGILHFLGSVMILSGIIEKLIKNDNLRFYTTIALIPLAFLLGDYFAKVKTEIPFLFPLGILTSDYKSYDYYPMFPWSGYFFLGVVIGQVVYKNKKSIFKEGTFADSNQGLVSGIKNIPINTLAFLGKYSIQIYFIHQPVLLFILTAFHLLIAHIQ